MHGNVALILSMSSCTDNLHFFFFGWGGKQNTSPAPAPGADGAQAVALRIAGDKAAFFRCGFYGAQDTLHDDRGRHYFKDCFIQGSIDFIYGSARSLYEVRTPSFIYTYVIVTYLANND